jgi:hydroxyethylthiazole kinase
LQSDAIIKTGDAMYTELKESIEKIKSHKPLILNLTNHVTMDLIANGLLALGAAPIMSEEAGELEELIHIASAVVVNIGTLNAAFIERMFLAAQLANLHNKPLILDPVGAGASRIRTETCTNLLSHYKVTVIRGNASEMMALTGGIASTQGVESTLTPEESVDRVALMCRSLQLHALMSGATDMVINPLGEKISLHYGSPLMPKVTGMGCLLTAVLGAFCAIESDPFVAAQQAVAFYSLCGELAAKEYQTPAAFRARFIDRLYQPDWHAIHTRLHA